MTDPAVLTVPEVARFLRVSACTVRRLIAHRALPHIRIGRQVRVFRSEIEALGRKTA